jgi:phosphatidylserine/phosphatidylglycerophosphate/cardiolipin synthase-like enzyme
LEVNEILEIVSTYPSHTNIPKANFTDTYNVTLFTNPDNADEVIFHYLNAAKSSIYVSMYTISRSDFNETLINLKQANPSMDIQVLISNRRVGAYENIDTAAAAQSLVDNGIEVYNSTTDDDKVDGYYHAKYWIIDGKHVFVYSGNWSPRSVTPEEPSYSSSEANRDMGIAVLDAPDIASFFKTEVWDEDVAVATAWSPLTSKNIDSYIKFVDSSLKIESPLIYTPTFEPLNLKEEMTLSPMFTPDNALDIHKAWLDKANNSIELQNQYITQFDDAVDWDNDPSPIVRSLIDARNRGVKIRVQVNEDSDSDNVTAYLINKGIDVRWMGNSVTSTDGSWLSDTHNKLIIIDDEVVLLSSINFGENAFTNNREAGFVIQNSNVANYYKTIFEADWNDGEIPPYLPSTGIKITSFKNGDVLSGTVTLTGQIFDLDNPTVSYRIGSGDYATITLSNDIFSAQFDTTTLSNGINTIEVKAVTINQTITDKVKINIVNYSADDNWRFLITELLPNPDGDDALGEYIELTNTFSFDLYLENWKVGDDNDLLTFPEDYVIKTYSSIIIARDENGFEDIFDETAEMILDFALNNDGDFVQLLDPKETHIDVVAYGDETAPDGSEVLDAPDSGVAILRFPLHIDTNTAADFIYGSPDPKGPVSTDTEETSFSLGAILIAIICIPLIRKKLK